jgi:CyaY protein
MADVSFSLRAEHLLEEILAHMEDCEELDDFDMDIVDGVLTLEFDDSSQIIVNRQEPLEQIWVASPLGPAHFAFDSTRDDWFDDKTGEPIYDPLEQALTTKLGKPVSLF